MRIVIFYNSHIHLYNMLLYITLYIITLYLFLYKRRKWSPELQGMKNWLYTGSPCWCIAALSKSHMDLQVYVCDTKCLQLNVESSGL